MKRYQLRRPDLDELQASALRVPALVEVAMREGVPLAEVRRLASSVALPSAWRSRDRLREPELPPADRLDLWGGLGASDALAGQPPRFDPIEGPQDPWAIAYASAYAAVLAAYLFPESVMDGPKQDTKVQIEIPAGGIDPRLAAAIVRAQAEAESLVRDGTGQHGSYTSSDEVAAVARRLLTAHGAAWLRVGVDLEDGRLGTTDLGNQAYVGDVVEHWILVHECGATLSGSSRMPVIASKGRPQDKAVGASLTYDAGHTLRGVLCLDREDKNHAVDRREDHDGPNSRPPAQPKGDDKLAKLRAAVDEKVERYAADFEITKAAAWSEACSMAGHPQPLGGGRGPHGCGFSELGAINRALKKVFEAGERGGHG